MEIQLQRNTILVLTITILDFRVFFKIIIKQILNEVQGNIDYISPGGAKVCSTRSGGQNICSKKSVIINAIRKHIQHLFFLYIRKGLKTSLPTIKYFLKLNFAKIHFLIILVVWNISPPMLFQQTAASRVCSLALTDYHL